MAVAPTVAAEKLAALRERFREMEAEREAALIHPAELLRHTSVIDPKTGEEFGFQFDGGWEWQREELTSFMSAQIVLRLKARQLGESWLGVGYCLWKCLCTPGTRAICVSINEEEASKLVNRAWDLWNSLPEHLQMEGRIIKPYKNRPSTRIEWEFPDGSISSLIAMPSTPRAGHGETASVVFLDEFARHQYAAESWKAFIPVIADGGQIIIVSTANGYGNEFYTLWMGGEDRLIETKFLGASLHPGRDDKWFAQMRLILSPADMSEQYPLNAAEAFLGTSGCWFSIDALVWYGERLKEPLYRCKFITNESGAKATIAKEENGWIGVYEKPVKNREYAIYADVATGRGLDFTAAYVTDLTNMDIVAELHGKIDPDLAAEQLHFLGRWYNTARIAVEMGGGFGEAVVIPLRDGKRGRRPYPKLYRHVQDDRPDYKQNITYGFPVTTKTRSLIISGMERAIREHDLPHLPLQLILECKTFVRRDTLPSPRAADGTNDDRVMACAGMIEMFRRYGQHPLDVRRSRRREKREYVPEYRW